jgi:hypothetical protein
MLPWDFEHLFSPIAFDGLFENNSAMIINVMGNCNLFAWCYDDSVLRTIREIRFRGFNFCTNLRELKLSEFSSRLQSQISQGMQSNTLRFHGLVFSHAMFSVVNSGFCLENLEFPYVVFWLGIEFHLFMESCFLCKELCIHADCTQHQYDPVYKVFFPVSCGWVVQQAKQQTGATCTFFTRNIFI